MKSKPKDNRKALFTVLGEVQMDGEKKKFAFSSPDHYHQLIRSLPVGKKLGVTFEEYKPTRTSSQLAYHWVLIGYLAEHTGHTKEEMHDYVMRQKFGTKEVTVLGKTEQVRRSIADMAKMPLSDCVELIEFDLALCSGLEIRVPTKTELGYLDG